MNDLGLMFVAGFIIGLLIGAFLISCLVVGKDADQKEEK